MHERSRVRKPLLGTKGFSMTTSHEIERVLCLIIVSSWLVVACSDSAKKIEVGGACILNSDCNSPLLCTDGKCHDACHASVDCPPGETCVKTNDTSICQLPAEADCSRTPCGGTYVCASDLRCRTVCQSAVDCAGGQVCVTSGCADLDELVTGTDHLPQKGPNLSADGGTDARDEGRKGAGEFRFEEHCHLIAEVGSR